MTKQKQSQTMAGGRIPRPGEVFGDLPASTAAELHDEPEGDAGWPGSDQPGSEGPPPGFEVDDPFAPPEPTVPPTDPAYQGEPSAPPEGFEPPDPDGPPPPVIEPTDPAYQGPEAVTPPGFEPPAETWEPGGPKPEEPEEPDEPPAPEPIV